MQNMLEWKLADAKNRFSDLVNRALAGVPQTVRRRGDAVVVISQADFDRLTGKKTSFKEHILNPPQGLDKISIERDKTPMRNVDL